MSYPQSTDEPRRDRQEILGSIKATVDHILVLHNLEIDALSRGDIEEWEATGHNLRKATEFKDSLVELYQLQIERQKALWCCNELPEAPSVL